jgi:flagellar biosynthesis/type III secretory pathway M-ring protein FliF/YscJ
MPQTDQDWIDFSDSIKQYSEKRKKRNFIGMVKKLKPKQEVVWVLATITVTGLTVFIILWLFVFPKLDYRYYFENLFP